MGALAAALRLVKIRRSFPRPGVRELEAAVRATFADAAPAIPPGGRVALAVGSRGISELARIVRATAECVRERGAEPFVVSAMGSHGGGTAEGQREVLAGYGVTEDGVGCPVRAAVEVVELPGAPDPEYRLFMDRIAYESDGVILVNRVKPHTDFHARYESGLVKMSVIGLGNRAQALEMHRHGVRGLVELLPRAAERVLATGKILLGLVIVENAHEEVMHLEAVRPERILEREPELLEIARAHLPRLPVQRLDLLVVDRMGKDVSGVGIDTNVIGRLRIPGQPEPERPEIGMIVVTDLTPGSHGNATGMGLADVTTRRFLGKLDLEVTNTNVATSGFLERGRLPVVADTDEQAVEWALRACGPIPPAELRAARILDSLHLDELYVSPAVLAEIAGGVEVIGESGECFGADGGLRPF
jgi:hypothetical protein